MICRGGPFSGESIYLDHCNGPYTAYFVCRGFWGRYVGQKGGAEWVDAEYEFLCNRCGGPRSKYSVSLCFKCYRAESAEKKSGTMRGEIIRVLLNMQRTTHPNLKRLPGDKWKLIVHAPTV